jgi:hypothetical protein
MAAIESFFADFENPSKRVRRARELFLMATLVAFVFSFVPQSATAQTAGTGALAGIVTDASGSSIAGAQVQVTNESSGEVRTVTTSATGNYIVPLLLPGSYRVEVTKPGFRTVTISHAQIVVTETNTLNIRLEVGEVSEKVVVEAQVQQLQTESSTLGRLTSAEQVNTLPLVTRNYTQIINLNPGVASEVNDAGAIGRGGLAGLGLGIVSNGGTTSDNNFQMNGDGINDLQQSGQFSGGIAIPNPDTIQEFKVQTSQYDASYGRNAGANVDLITKGGTNEFHGSLWEYLRNDDLNANSFFRNAEGQPKPVLKENQFGFTFGGPIKKDKLMFFTSYQGSRQRNGIDPGCSATITEPPLTNDRSALAIATIFNGQRGIFQNAFGGVGPAIDVNSPQTNYNINPVALALLQLKLPNGQYAIPTPQTINPNAKSFDAEGTSAFSVPCPYTEDQFMTNADYQMSSKSKLSARFFFANSYLAYTLPQANLGGGTAPGFPVDLTNNFRNFTLTHTYIFTPALLNQIELGFHRTFALYDQTKVFSYSQIGSAVPPADNTIPAIAIDFPSNTGLTLGGNGQTVRAGENTYTVQDSLSWNKGKHTFRFGGGIARYQDNQVGFHYLAGEAYLSWPDFLLGLSGPQNGTGAFSNIFASLDALGLFDRAFRVLDGNAYAQDDIKLTRRLTLNLGLRYDRIGDFADALGRNASFNASLANPNPPAAGTIAGTTLPANYSGGAIPPGATQLGNNYGINGDGQNTWNPRLGFAWQLPHTDKLVLRGGYGVYHSRSTGQPFIQLLTAPPFGQIREFVGPPNATASEANPLPLNVPTFPAFVPYSPATSNAISVFDPNFRPPMIQEYSLGIQAQLTPTMELEVGYSGERGLHLIRERSINQADLASASDPIRGQTTDTLANIPLRVPYEGWSASNMIQIESAGASWYNALLVGLNKRFSHGLQFQASYTFARDLSTDFGSTTGPNGGDAVGDQNNPTSRYGPDSFIREHRFVVNYTYQLPGPHTKNAFVHQALGGWMIAGVTTIQSGHLLTVTYTNGSNIYGITNDRASLSGTCTPGQYVKSGSPSSLAGTSTEYINTSCFTAPALINPAPPLGDGATGFGNSGVGILEGPGQVNFDIGILKHFPLHWPRETAQLEFRTEFFNAFNHPQFGDPSTAFGTPNFGQITDTVVAPRILQFALKLSF